MNDFTAKVTGINWDSAQGVGMVEYDGGARGQFAVFYNRAVHDPIASGHAGRPIHKDRIYIRVSPPGERLNVVDRPATEDDKRRWPLQWHQFTQNHEQIPEGTPIGQLYPEKPSIEQTLKGSGVHTIEQCAELSGNAIENIGMGAQSWVNAAKAYLEKANKGVTITQHRREMEDKNQKIKLLERQVAELSGQLQLMQQQSSTAVSMQQVQEMLAGMMGRPSFPPPGTTKISNQFDPQTQQINAVNSANRRRPRVK